MKKKLLNKCFKFQIKIFFRQETQSSATSDFNIDFSFVISNQDEFNYAKNLICIYRDIYLPFLKKHETKLARNSERMSRLFFIGGQNITDGSKYGYYYQHVGKSFVNLKTSKFIRLPHFPSGKRYDVPHNYISHYRNNFIFYKTDKSIRLLNFDFNFFICYVGSLI